MEHESDRSLDVILAELSRREPIFHREEFGRTRTDFDRMMAPEFWEIGASGRRYSREFVLDELERRYSGKFHDVWKASEFAVQRLAEETFLLTYLLLQDGTRLTRRTTIWRRTKEASWEIVFHQGTVVERG